MLVFKGHQRDYVRFKGHKFILMLVLWDVSLCGTDSYTLLILYYNENVIIVTNMWYLGF